MCFFWSGGIATAQDNVTADTSIREVLEIQEQTDELLKEKAAASLTASQADTPLSALLGLSDAYRRGDFEAAAEYMDMRYLSDELDGWTNEDLIQALSVIWRQQNILDIASVSDEPEGHLDDSLPSYRELLGTIKLEKENVPIYLQRVPDGNGGKVWKVSNATVARIPEMWEGVGYSDTAVYLMQTLPQFEFMGLQNWQIIFIVVFFILAWPAAILISAALLKVCLLIPNGFPLAIERFLKGPVRFFIFVLLALTLSDQLGLSLRARILLESVGIDYIAIIVLSMGALSLLRDYQIRKLQRVGLNHYATLLTPLTTMVKILVLTVIGLIWADSAGYNMSTILAGLGVGSLAIALAAQKTLENVFGAITLYMARPVQAGDFCRFGEVVGTVEEIGLRSTAIRTLNRSLVLIPNSVFASGDIENYTARDRIRYFRYVRVQAGTSDQLRVVLANIRKLLLSHPRIRQDSVSVRFEEIEDATALLRVDGGVETKDFQEYLAVAEDLNLQLIDILAEAGLALAGPTRSILMREQSDSADTQTELIEQTVDEWRKQDGLPFPDYTDDEAKAMKGTASYPGVGPLSEE